MARVQLALNVSDLDRAVDFYSKLFGVEVNKRKPGYANFAIDEPPLKLVLIEGQGGGALNHLGVEVESVDEVEMAHRRLNAEGLAATDTVATTCCYAEKTETWVTDPDGAPWEIYVKTADADQMVGTRGDEDAVACCAPQDAVSH